MLDRLVPFRRPSRRSPSRSSATLPRSLPEMNWFRWRSKSLNISECDPTYKVKYLGNVLTTFVRGEGCVDRPLSMIWNNYLANPSACVDMQLTVTNSGLRAVTKPSNQQSGSDNECVTEYRCHRISYCVHQPQFPKLFVWVYRHEGRKLKVEVRCHAVLCKSEAKTKAMHVQLRDRMTFALSEFGREKTRRQNSRLVIQRTRSVPAGVGGIALPVRTQLLRQGQHFKPSTSNANNAPHLGVISEELEEPEVAGPNRLAWQRRAPQQQGAERDAASGVEGQRRRGWLSAGDEQRDSGDGDDVDDDDSVFLFKPPISVDCRLSDVFLSFSEIVSDDATPSQSSAVCLSPSADPFPDPSIIRGSDAAPDSSEAGLSYPILRSPLSETDLDTCGLSWEKRTDPEGMETPKVSELDDQSIESGFSEQDAHDL